MLLVETKEKNPKKGGRKTLKEGMIGSYTRNLINKFNPNPTFQMSKPENTNNIPLYDIDTSRLNNSPFMGFGSGVRGRKLENQRG